MTASMLANLPATARAPLSPRIRRLKDRLQQAECEICLARARHFTAVYRETEGVEPALRNALALKRTLERQRIRIDPDELVVGTKTERFLSTPLPVERGDFLRALELEMDVLDRKRRPFRISAEDRRWFWRELVPFWRGRTVHDRKAELWEESGIVVTRGGLRERVRSLAESARFVRYVGPEDRRNVLGANLDAPLTPRRARNLYRLRHELALNNPTPAVYCMDVQGHLCLGIDTVIELGMEKLIEQARGRRERLAREAPADARGHAFLEAAEISLRAALGYAERFADLAESMAAHAVDPSDAARLRSIAAHCRHVPRHPPRTFHEAIQSAWMTQAVAEIQFGTMDVFTFGRIDQFMWPTLERDLAAGRISDARAIELLQELFLKLSANVSPTPEIGMESNGVLGNSQHCVIVGGWAPDGRDGTNPLSHLVLDAYEQMAGCVNQVCVRIHARSPRSFVRRAAQVFRRANGIAFYNDEALVPALLADGFTLEDARDYTIVGCVETCGHSNTQGCVAGHDLVLPAVLMLTVTDGSFPPRALGQGPPYRSGDPASFASFEALLAAFERQLRHQLDTLVTAIAGKDTAHRELLPAPFVSALVDGCIERARDVTDGGARYDFTSVDVRGLATLIDSLMAIERVAYETRELSLPELVAIVLANFRGHEPLRQRLLRTCPKYGSGDERADALARRVVAAIHAHLATKRNVRGGRYRAAYFSLGNHVIDGFMLGATPDGRLRDAPISNGISSSNLIGAGLGPQAVMRAAASFPPAHVSSGVSLNLRFHPRFIETAHGLETFTSLVETYFALGGIHLQPNFASTETLREAQRHPERHRDLIVKVSGYSACFVDLGRSIQEDIISRAEL